MDYTFIDLDNRRYHRNTTEPIVIESRMNPDGCIEISVASQKGALIILNLNESEATAISSALAAAKANCTSTVRVSFTK